MPPGCEYGHSFRVRKAANDSRPRVPVWEWNGDYEKPTFTPSLLVNSFDPKTRCHLYVRDGVIEFLTDCWHGLAGTKAPMEDDD